MSVIAKMSVSATRLFSDGNALVNLSCVYDNDLSKTENEDVRFTKASPFGTAELTIEKGPDLPPNGGQVYILFDDQGNPPSFEGCLFALIGRCISILDSGYTKQVEVGPGYISDDLNIIPEGLRIGSKRTHFNLKMGIDNPGAYLQLVPTKDYWITVYDADKFSMHDVLTIARTGRNRR